MTIPHKEAALALATTATRRRPRDRRREHAELRRGRRDRRREHRRAGAHGRARRAPPASALVLGAGGSARAVVWALTHAGTDVSVWNRTPRARARASARASSTTPVAAEVLVNCTSVGLDRSVQPVQGTAPRCRFAGRIRDRGGPGLQGRRNGAGSRGGKAGREHHRWRRDPGTPGRVELHHLDRPPAPLDAMRAAGAPQTRGRLGRPTPIKAVPDAPSATASRSRAGPAARRAF